MNFKEKVKLMKKVCEYQKRISELEAAKKRAELALRELIENFNKTNHNIGGAEWN
jgi:hypothetical protein